MRGRGGYAPRKGEIFRAGRRIEIGIAARGRPGGAEVIGSGQGHGAAAVGQVAEADTSAAADQEDVTMGAGVGGRRGQNQRGVRIGAGGGIGLRQTGRGRGEGDQLPVAGVGRVRIVGRPVRDLGGQRGGGRVIPAGAGKQVINVIVVCVVACRCCAPRK